MTLKKLQENECVCVRAGGGGRGVGDTKHFFPAKLPLWPFVKNRYVVLDSEQKKMVCNINVLLDLACSCTVDLKHWSLTTSSHS